MQHRTAEGVRFLTASVLAQGPGSARILRAALRIPAEGISRPRMSSAGMPKTTRRMRALHRRDRRSFGGCPDDWEEKGSPEISRGNKPRTRLGDTS